MKKKTPQIVFLIVRTWIGYPPSTEMIPMSIHKTRSSAKRRTDRLQKRAGKTGINSGYVYQVEEVPVLP